jgi:hypothetical protein
MNNHSQGGRLHYRDSNRALSEYKFRALLLRKPIWSHTKGDINYEYLVFHPDFRQFTQVLE